MSNPKLRCRPCSVAALSGLLLFLSGCALQLGNVVTGSGVEKSEKRDVSGFSAVTLSGVGKVVIEQTSKESLTVSADDNILPLLETRVENDTLILRTADNTNLRPKTPIVFTVEVKDLKTLTVSGAGSVEVTKVAGQRLAVFLSGVGSVTAAGTADLLELTLSGTGSFDGEKLAAKKATVRATGVGSAVVNAAESLEASVSGVGSVEYIGSPEVKKSVSGIGTVRKR
jgi:hypothetical protein